MLGGKGSVLALDKNVSYFGPEPIISKMSKHTDKHIGCRYRFTFGDVVAQQAVFCVLRIIEESSLLWQLHSYDLCTINILSKLLPFHLNVWNILGEIGGCVSVWVRWIWKYRVHWLFRQHNVFRWILLNVESGRRICIPSNPEDFCVLFNCSTAQRI